MSVPTPILQYNLSDASVKGLLPSGYTPLAYIESSGTLYINTGIAFNGASSTYLINCRVGASTRAGHAHSFFGTASYLTGFMGIYHYTNNNYYSEYIANANKGTQGLVIAAGNIFDYYLKMNMSARTYASKLAYASEVTGSFNAMSDTSTPLRIFKSDDYSGGYWKCYYFSITKDNVLQVDLIPARRDSDGVIGMYDLVSRTFKTNSGSGTFIAGPELAVGKGGGKSLPEEYLLVEYLLSSGVEHINTNFTPNQNSRVEFLGCLTQDKTSGSPEKWHACYSEDNSWNNSSFGAWFNDTVYSYYGVEQYGSGSTYGTSVGLKATLNKRFYVDLNKNVLYWKYVGDSSNQYSKTFNSSITFTGACPLVLLATNRNGSVLAQSHFIGRIEYAKIYDNGTLVRNMIPCYRKSDGKPGMYDVVNGVFYTNAGSGEFILGPSVINCYTWEPNAGSGTLQGLYVDCNSIYDVNKGWCLSGNDSTYSYVEFPKEIMNPLMTAKTFTIAFWFRVHNTNRHILFGSNSSYPLNIEYYTSGTKMRYYFIGAPDKMGSTTIATNTWYHVALCVTSTGFTAYINGNVDASHTSAPTFNQFTGNCRIGSDSRDTQIYLGSDILNFMIFDTTLTAAQIKELYGK